MVALTESAKEAIRGLIEGNDAGMTGLRIVVQQGGCAGLQYMLGLEREAQEGDEVFDYGDVRVFVDPQSLPIIDGMRVDFVNTVESSGFTFENPNVGNTCSCGKSFSC